MKLKLKRDQQSGITGKITFILEARAELTDQEAANIKKYKFGKDILYSKEKIPTAGLGDAITQGNIGLMSGMTTTFLAKALNLTISINDLVKGKRIECKEITEMLGAEEQIKQACGLLKEILESAATFGGEEIIEI